MAVEIHEPDHMGAWEEDGSTVWLPKSHYPTRHQARTFAMQEWSCHFLDVRVLSRWMRYTPLTQNYPGDWWSECAKDEPGAFPVWRLEAVA